MNIGKRLEGKVAIVTGGASGIGAETARTFAAHGASVTVADVQDDLGKSIVEEIKANGGTARYMTLDVADEAAWAELVGATAKAYGALHVLGNIAGISGRDPNMVVQTSGTAGPRLEDQTLEQWNRVMEINATGVFLGTKAAIPHMREAGGGSIINISSICGIVGSHANAGYHASRARFGSSQSGGDPIRARQDPGKLDPSGLRRRR